MAALLLWLVGFSPFAPSARHVEFRENEAHFLLSTRERAAFDQLSTDAEKDRFIEGFWARRDVEAHRERLVACDRLFGPRGRHSERGRIYQLLGPPRFRETPAMSGDRLFPVELWHYTGVTASFLPDAFYLVFFRAGGSGAFRLWNPETDGVSALVPSAEPRGVRADALERVDPELALAAAGLVPGGSASETRSLLPNVDAYADLVEQERAYGARVHSAVTTRALETTFRAVVLTDDAGVPEVHYALDIAAGESRVFDWQGANDRYRVPVTLIGRLMTARGERERWEDALELDVTETERDKLSDTRIRFRGRRLIHPDDRSVEVALVIDGGGAIAHAPLEPLELAAPIPEASGSPVRVLERERTAAERARYLLARARSLSRRGELDRAVETLREAAASSPNDVGVHLSLARSLFLKRDFEGVLAHLSGVEARFAAEPDVYVLMAASAGALGQHGEALVYYEQAAALRPDDEALLRALADARRRAGR